MTEFSIRTSHPLKILLLLNSLFSKYLIWTASSEFGTYRLCEQRWFRRACASAQSRQNLRCSLIQAVSQEEPSDRKPDPWPLWMAGHAQLKLVMTKCSKTQIRLTGLNLRLTVRICSDGCGQYLLCICLCICALLMCILFFYGRGRLAFTANCVTLYKSY